MSPFILQLSLQYFSNSPPFSTWHKQAGGALFCHRGPPASPTLRPRPPPHKAIANLCHSDARLMTGSHPVSFPSRRRTFWQGSCSGWAAIGFHLGCFKRTSSHGARRPSTMAGAIGAPGSQRRLPMKRFFAMDARKPRRMAWRWPWRSWYRPGTWSRHGPAPTPLAIKRLGESPSTPLMPCSTTKLRLGISALGAMAGRCRRAAFRGPTDPNPCRDVDTRF